MITPDPETLLDRILAEQGPDLDRLKSWLSQADPAQDGVLAGLRRIIADLPAASARRRRAPRKATGARPAALTPGERAAIADLLRHLDGPPPHGLCVLPRRSVDAEPREDLYRLVRDIRFRFRVYANPPPPAMPDTPVIVIGEIMDGEDFETLARTLLRYNGQALAILRDHYGFA